MAREINNILIPSVTSLPSQKKVDQSNLLEKGQKSEFSELLQAKNLENQNEVSLSSHVVKRLEERQIDFDSNEYLKLKEAVAKLRDKGGRDSLVVTDKAAYIVDVKNSKVVTAVDKMNMNENVFTKIDSTLFI